MKIILSLCMFLISTIVLAGTEGAKPKIMRKLASSTVCGLDVGTAQAEVKDNYLGGKERSDKPFLDAIILFTPSSTITICEENENIYLVYKQKTGITSGVFAYPKIH